MMEPGKELDALVAEKVMGFSVIDNGDGPFLYKHRDYFEWQNYSTDIAAAWKVVEHLRSRESEQGYYDVWISAAGGTYPYWCGEKRDKKNTVEIFINTGAKHREIARGESDISVPHAICLAALEAVR